MRVPDWCGLHDAFLRKRRILDLQSRLGGELPWRCRALRLTLNPNVLADVVKVEKEYKGRQVTVLAMLQAV